jgi:hypothetical protein
MILAQSNLLPGDCLLYEPAKFNCLHPTAWLFGNIIAVKTWTRLCHVEIFAGLGTSVASRDGQGVGAYELRMQGLACVRRPPANQLDINAAFHWFNGVEGQKYDWKGLLCFTLAVHQGAPDRMFCSEFALRWYRAAGFEVLNPEADADHTAPSELWQAGTLATIWKK